MIYFRKNSLVGEREAVTPMDWPNEASENEILYLYHGKIRRAMDEVLQRVLSKYLNREVTIDDAKRVTIGRFQNDSNRMLVSYDSVHLGTVMIDYGDYTKQEYGVSVRFEPR